MFEHFTFGACAQTLYEPEDDIAASPTNTSFPTSISASAPGFFDEFSPLDGIVNAFAQSSLRLDENEQPQPSICIDYLPSPCFSNDDAHFAIEEITYVSTRRNMAKIPLKQFETSMNMKTVIESRSETVASRRARKMMEKISSEAYHGRDINALVEDMIVTGEQCTLHSSTRQRAFPTQSTPPTPTSPVEESIVHTTPFVSPPEDEGFGEMEEDITDLLDIERFKLEMDDEMTLRRAGSPSGIRKAVGKYNVVKWRKSADAIGNGPGVTSTGRAKVRCVPRMRRRRIRTVNE